MSIFFVSDLIIIIFSFHFFTVRLNTVISTTKSNNYLTQNNSEHDYNFINSSFFFRLQFRMTAFKEIVTLQIGHYSNFVGTNKCSD